MYRQGIGILSGVFSEWSDILNSANWLSRREKSMGAVRENLPELPDAPSVFDTKTPMKSYRFSNSADLMALFQAQLDRFPRVQQGGVKRLMFSEFGGIMIRPQGESLNRLTDIVFPETHIAIPRAGKSLRGHSERSFPSSRIMADTKSDTLYVTIMADHLTDDDLTERVSLILTMNDIFFTSDLFNYFSLEDQQYLAQYGFGPNLKQEQWANAINKFPQAYINQYEINGRIVTVRELPSTINQRGSVGTMNSFHQMPGYILNTLNQNAFTEDGSFFEIGSAHIHPETELIGLSADIAGRIGEKKLQMTLSPADVAFARASMINNNIILKKYQGREKDTGETFMSVIGVDRQGEVTGIRHVDLGLIDDIDKMAADNDRVKEMLTKGTPDIGLIVAHYEFFSDPSISSEQLGGGVGQHVGDPTRGE